MKCHELVEDGGLPVMPPTRSGFGTRPRAKSPMTQAERRIRLRRRLAQMRTPLEVRR
jgi:hypothetical protein